MFGRYVIPELFDFYEPFPDRKHFNLIIDCALRTNNAALSKQSRSVLSWFPFGFNNEVLRLAVGAGHFDFHRPSFGENGTGHSLLFKVPEATPTPRFVIGFITEQQETEGKSLLHKSYRTQHPDIRLQSSRSASKQDEYLLADPLTTARRWFRVCVYKRPSDEVNRFALHFEPTCQGDKNRWLLLHYTSGERLFQVDLVSTIKHFQ